MNKLFDALKDSSYVPESVKKEREEARARQERADEDARKATEAMQAAREKASSMRDARGRGSYDDRSRNGRPHPSRSRSRSRSPNAHRHANRRQQQSASERRSGSSYDRAQFHQMSQNPLMNNVQMTAEQMAQQQM